MAVMLRHCKPPSLYSGILIYGISRHATAHKATAVLNNHHLRNESKSVNPFPDLDKVDFTDCKKAFASKTFLQLVRGYTVFGLCSFTTLVDNQQKVKI